MRHCFLPLLLALCACAPQVQPFAPADHVASVENDSFTAPDGVVLPARSWMPKHRPEAVIVAVHGFNDYSNAFTLPGEYFRQQSIATFAYDQRGFGKAPGTGIWAGENNLVRDLAECVRQTQRRYPGVPVYIIGESMGGAVAIAALADPTFPKVQGAILVAPAVWGEQTMNVIYLSTLWFATYTMPSLTLTGKDLKILASDNIPMLRKMGADPLVIKATRVDAIHGLVNLMSDAYDKISDVHTPMLILYGGHDEVIPPEPVRNALNHIDEPVTYAYYPDGYHMLLRDLEGEMVMKDIVHWIEHPDAPLPSGHGEKRSVKKAS